MSKIAVFDSGVGGLTVLRALRKKWPGENFLYLADTARLPYGNKSLGTIQKYVDQNIRFLETYSPKAIVVACNSASTALLNTTKKYNLPVFNVIEPGARQAVAKSENGRIGVLATRTTVHSEAYPKAIRKLKPETEIFQQACPLWVPLVEEGWIEDPVTNLIVYRYASRIFQQNVDTVVLGCTHFPVLIPAILKAVQYPVHLIDSSLGLIEDLAAIDPNTAPSGGRLDILSTDFSPRLEETIRLLLGEPFDSLELVDLKDS
ncbi:MAG: glutamate racemase [Bdellovibrionales bacterium]